MQQIDARELIRTVLPDLRTTRHQIETVLKERIEACRDEEERRRLNALQDELSLEMMMIRMNLDHLLKRYDDQLKAVSRGEQDFSSPLLTLDDAEAKAIEHAKRFSVRARQLQVG